MRTLFVAVVVATCTVVCVQPAAAQGSQDTSQASLLAAREKVWRDYFANGADLPATLPDGFVAIHAGDSSWGDRAATLAGAKRSAARGTKVTGLRFPRNQVERYGNVAVIHSRYELDLESTEGKNSMRGQITEVFVWNGKRWIHPSWHMDFDRP